ncbi:MAG: GTP 3',8-cyclase MoaA [Candidatus Methylacidiphilales bacterium]
MNDPFGRIIDYLRISVTDRCNERCLYCMPQGYHGWAQRQDHLTADEIVSIVQAATELGFRKFRVTGGEPLVRHDIVSILTRIWDLPGVQTLGLSTNATRLAELAPSIKQAGVRSLNISLDALDPTVYQRLTGGDLTRVLAGIETARREQFEVIKLNCVLLRGLNESEIEPLIAFAAARDMPLRFIEWMPLSSTDALNPSHFFSIEELKDRLRQKGSLTPLPAYRPGHGPAQYWLYEPSGLSGPVKLGFIGALTTHHFCESCNKLRLTADGKLRPCLGRTGEIDLRQVIRAGGNPSDALRQAIANKPENHEFLNNYQPLRPMTAIGG